MTLFLMADSDLEEYRTLEARAAGVDHATIEAAFKSAAPMQIEGDTATIQIKGTLTPKRIGFLDFFGIDQTVWGDITGQIEQAEKSGLKNVILETNSGGGMIDGMFDAMDAIATSPLNIIGSVTGQAQSAAYMLLSQADSIDATREYNMIGSIGVKVSDSPSEEVSNSDSPLKVSGSKTEDGKPAVQGALDEIYGMILPRMADGRNTTIDTINSDWGKGGTMTAKTALQRGMIDSIQEPKKAGRSGIKQRNAMNKETLKAEHPDLYASVMAEGKEIGKAEFLELASAHSALSEMSGDKDRALADIIAGNGITPTCQVHHTTVATKRAMIEKHGEEAPAPVGEGKDLQSEAMGDGSEDAKAQKEIDDAYAAAGLEVMS